MLSTPNFRFIFVENVSIILMYIIVICNSTYYSYTGVINLNFKNLRKQIGTGLLKSILSASL